MIDRKVVALFNGAHRISTHQQKLFREGESFHSSSRRGVRKLLILSVSLFTVKEDPLIYFFVATVAAAAIAGAAAVVNTRTPSTRSFLFLFARFIWQGPFLPVLVALCPLSV